MLLDCPLLASLGQCALGHCAIVLKLDHRCRVGCHSLREVLDQPGLVDAHGVFGNGGQLTPIGLLQIDSLQLGLLWFDDAKGCVDVT